MKMYERKKERARKEVREMRRGRKRGRKSARERELEEIFLIRKDNYEIIVCVCVCAHFSLESNMATMRSS